MQHSEWKSIHYDDSYKLPTHFSKEKQDMKHVNEQQILGHKMIPY